MIVVVFLISMFYLSIILLIIYRLLVSMENLETDWEYEESITMPSTSFHAMIKKCVCG
jgi:hypothetical protein